MIHDSRRTENAGELALLTAKRVQRIDENSLRPKSLAGPQGGVSLAVGQPDQSMPRELSESLYEAALAGFTRYPDASGDPELRDAIALHCSRESGAHVDADEVLVTHGGSAGIVASILAVVNPGDTVLIPEPTYSLYQDAVLMAGGTPHFLQLERSARLPMAEIREAATEAKLLILCSPGNPTGAVITAEEYQALEDICNESNLMLMVDEAYADLTYSSRFVPALSVKGLRDRIILIRTFSKSYRMTGMRLGWVIAPKLLISSIRTSHKTFNGGINASVQRMGITALEHHSELVTPLVEEYGKRRDEMARILGTIEGLEWSQPDGAFYFLVSYPGTLSSQEMVERLAKRGVTVRSGREFGPSGEGSIRLSFAASLEDIKSGLKELKEELKSALC